MKDTRTFFLFPLLTPTTTLTTILKTLVNTHTHTIIPPHTATTAATTPGSTAAATASPVAELSDSWPSTWEEFRRRLPEVRWLVSLRLSAVRQARAPELPWPVQRMMFEASPIETAIHNFELLPSTASDSRGSFAQGSAFAASDTAQAVPLPTRLRAEMAQAQRDLERRRQSFADAKTRREAMAAREAASAEEACATRERAQREEVRQKIIPTIGMGLLSRPQRRNRLMFKAGRRR